MDAMALAQQQLLAQAGLDPNLLAQQQAAALMQQQAAAQALQQQHLLQQQSALVAQHQSAMAAQQQVKLMTDDGQNPKQVLNQFCLKFCGRQLGRDDIVYTVNKFGVQFQAICKLTCLGGQEVVGHLCHNAVDAEKSAAMMCIEAYRDQIAAMPKEAMRLPPVAQQAPPVQAQALPAVDAAAIFAANAAKRARFQHQQAELGKVGQAVPTPTANPNQLEALAAEQLTQQMQQMLGGMVQSQPLPQPPIQQPAVQSTSFTLPQAFSFKMQLNTFGMKLAKRVLKHGETVYETRFENGMHQSSVKLAWLPDEWKEQSWIGDPCVTKQAAEHNAAEKTLMILQGDEALSQRANEKVTPTPLAPVTRENPDPLGFERGVGVHVVPPRLVIPPNFKGNPCDKGKGKMADIMWGLTEGLDQWGKAKGGKPAPMASKGDPLWSGNDAWGADDSWKGKGSKGDDTWSGKGCSGKGDDSWGSIGDSGKSDDSWGGKGIVISGKGDDAWGGKGSSGKGDDIWGSTGDTGKGDDSWGGKGIVISGKGDDWGGKGDSVKGDDSWSSKGGSGKGDDTWSGKGSSDSWSGKVESWGATDTWNGNSDSWSSKSEPWGGKGDSWNGKGDKGTESWSGDLWSGEGAKGKSSYSKSEPYSSKGDSFHGKDKGSSKSEPWSSKGDSFGSSKGEPWSSKGDSFGGKDKGCSKGEPWSSKGDSFSGKDKGFSKGKKGKGSKSDIVFERARVTDLPAFGEILQYRDKFGWIKPAEEFHDDQGKTHDRLYFNMKDVASGVQLEAGYLVQFHIYKDNAGVGAEDIKPL